VAVHERATLVDQRALSRQIEVTRKVTRAKRHPGAVRYHYRLMKRLGLVCAAVALWAVATPAHAHPVPFSFLDLHLQPGAAGTIDGTLIAHSFDIAHDLNVTPAERVLDPAAALAYGTAIANVLARRFAIVADGRPLVPEWTGTDVVADRQSLRLHVRFHIDRAPAALSVSGSMFPYDPNHETFINIYDGDRLSQAILDRDHSRYDYSSSKPQSALSVVRKFLPAGIHHILIGPDHLLFLVGLLLLGGTIRQLTLVVTAFTLAHSLTLSLAALNIVTPPARIIEPAIALSIVYVGADNLLVRGGRDVRAWIAFTFGFIHGFGFANVLREMDLPTRALGWSLFSFNIGVEIGQLLVVAVVASTLAALRSRSEAVGRQLAFAGSVVVVAAGTFWFIQRVFFPGGIS
jgi:hydrogenase/urease accessory protein HupE